MITLQPGDKGTLNDETWIVYERLPDGVYGMRWRARATKRNASRIVGALGSPVRPTLAVSQVVRWHGYNCEILDLEPPFCRLQLPAELRKVEVDLQGMTVAFGPGPSYPMIGDVVMQNLNRLTWAEVV